MAAWMRAMEGVDAARDLLDRVDAPLPPAEQRELVVKKAEMDRLLVLKHELALRRGALRQAHVNLLKERNNYLKRVLALEELVHSPDAVAPAAGHDGLVANSKLVSVVRMVLAASRSGEGVIKRRGLVPSGAAVDSR